MLTATTGELKKIYALRDLPEPHLKWILERCEYREMEDGAILTKTGDPIDTLWLILEGQFNFYLDVSGRLIHYYTFENNKETGGVGGLLPYSRLKTSPGYTILSGKGKLFGLHKKYFSALEALNPDFTQQLIGYMTERAKVFAIRQLQHEKINELGKLSAGIAHELNNPASAVTRISDELEKRLQLNYNLTEKILKQKIEPEQIASLREKANQVNRENETAHKLTAIQKLEKEDEINNWLDVNGLDECRPQSETFTEAGWSVHDLEDIRDKISADAFCDVIRWLENLLISGWLLKDLSEASIRISNLVGAIKNHVHMDRTNERMPTNIHTGIVNSITLLGYKIREKNITVHKKFSDAIPEINAYVSELNQVWSNIIDNAIFALQQNGHLTIETSKTDNELIVRIVDNGAGIPSNIKPHIFEPYFTTKSMGEGSGIGLDLVNRIINKHNGKIEVISEPGRTEFCISLPITVT